MSRCGVCGVRASSFQVYRNKFIEAKKADLTNPEVVNAQKVFFYLVFQYSEIEPIHQCHIIWLLCLHIVYKSIAIIIYVHHHDSCFATEQNCPGALVFFKTRYAAVVASRVLQSSNPMLWVTDLAPEPRDVYWSNLWIPYKQIWLRKLATLAASVVFMFVFIVPVAFVQSMMQLEQLKKMFPSLTGLLNK